jgi:Sec7-like guanine-nucleotide exchange factor
MRAKEFISEDRKSMLAYIREHCPQWDLEKIMVEFEHLSSHPTISQEWKDKINELLLRTAEVNSKFLITHFEGDPDKQSLMQEYIALAEQMQLWYSLRANY